MKLCINGTLQSYKKLTKEYVQSLIDLLNERFPNLPLFNATKLFIPYYHS